MKQQIPDQDLGGGRGERQADTLAGSSRSGLLSLPPQKEAIKKFKDGDDENEVVNLADVASDASASVFLPHITGRTILSQFLPCASLNLKCIRS